MGWNKSLARCNKSICIIFTSSKFNNPCSTKQAALPRRTFWCDVDYRKTEIGTSCLFFRIITKYLQWHRYKTRVWHPGKSKEVWRRKHECIPERELVSEKESERPLKESNGKKSAVIKVDFYPYLEKFIFRSNYRLNASRPNYDLSILGINSPLPPEVQNMIENQVDIRAYI